MDPLLAHYMDELKNSLHQQVELHKEYNELSAQTRKLMELADGWKDASQQWEKRAEMAEAALKKFHGMMSFQSNILNRQN